MAQMVIWRPLVHRNLHHDLRLNPCDGIHLLAIHPVPAALSGKSDEWAIRNHQLFAPVMHLPTSCGNEAGVHRRPAGWYESFRISWPDVGFHGSGVRKSALEPN